LSTTLILWLTRLILIFRRLIFLRIQFNYGGFISEGGLTKKNIREVRLLVNHSFDRFEEREVTDISELGTIEGIAIKTLDMSNLLHDYSGVLNNSKNTARGFELMVGVFAILDELLYLGVTPCNAHIARQKLASLFDHYEQGEAEQFEELLTEIDDYIKEERAKHLSFSFTDAEIRVETYTTIPTEL